MATWIVVSYATLVTFLGIVGWFTSKKGVPDFFIMAQALFTLPSSYLVARIGLSGVAAIAALDVAGLIQAGVLWVFLGGLGS
ncbi:hypothetical protein [Nonomuraea sp. B5E05]|uniref:hypothetical protein n=1 Tax=Nonomuraea sp. B5E05 TaxID=3153569 RepID=UPI003260636F